jgi:hypothetical protein
MSVQAKKRPAKRGTKPGMLKIEGGWEDAFKSPSKRRSLKEDGQNHEY